MKTSKHALVSVMAIAGTAAIILLATASVSSGGEATWMQTYAAAQKLNQEGDWPEALRTAKLALYKAKGTFGTNSLNVAKSHSLLGDLWGQRGKFVSAEMHYKAGIELREKLLSPNHPSLIVPLTVLADVYVTQGKTEQATFNYTRAIMIGRWNDPSSVGAMVGLAGVSRVAEKHVEAETLLKTALNLCDTYAKYDSSLNVLAARTLNDLAELNDARGNYRAAAEYYRKALAVHERGDRPENLVMCTILTRLANTCTKYGSVALAKNYKQRAMALYAKAIGPKAARGMMPEL